MPLCVGPRECQGSDQCLWDMPAAFAADPRVEARHSCPDGPSGTRRRKEKLVLYSILKCPFIPEVLSFFFFFWPIFYYEKNFKHAWKLKQFDTEHPVFSIARSSHEQFTVVVPHLTVGASSLPSQVLRPPDSDLGREGSPLITAGSLFFSSLG